MHHATLRTAALITAVTFASPAVAHQEPLSFDRISFTVSADEEVDNDTLVAILYHQRDGQKASSLADEVNKTIAWAVERAGQVPGVKVQTLQYRQDPVYRNQSLSGWRVRQSIRLEAREVAALSTLIGELQQRLSVQSLRYAISPDARREVEARLIARALSRFRQRAELIARELDRPEFRIVTVDVSTSGAAPPPVPMRAMATAESLGSVAPPTLSPGVQSVIVHVTATIELQAGQ